MPVLPRVGDLFGRYRIDAQIGQGGMGVVFGATDTVVGRTVALKVVSVGLGDPAQTEDYRRRFEREAATLARLDSPHVIAIYDYGTHDGSPYIATQYVGGGDVGDLLRARGPMPAALALRVCAQVADALHDAHRVGVVHRDVKPTNVLLRDADTLDVHAYLCDFGIARTATDGLTRAGAVAGTWTYLAPECGRGAPGTPASDVYALGCLLWATLTGSPPFRGSDVEVAVAHQQAPVPQLGGHDELTARIDDVLRRCLAKDPSARYPSADRARADLLAAAAAPGAGRVVAAPSAGGAGRPTPTPGTGPGTGSGTGSGSGMPLLLGTLPPRSSPTPVPAPRRRRTTGVVALVCAAVVAIAGGVFAAVQVADDDAPTAGPSGPGPATPTGSTSLTPAPDSGPTGPAEPPAPTRVDEGGPVSGDLDGDGLGDLAVEYYHTVTSKEGDESFTDLTTWRSTGEAFVQQGGAERLDEGDPDAYGQPVVGDFDGDDVLETIVVEASSDPDRVRVRGDLSGGGEVGGEVAKRDDLAYVAVSDLDADGSDDLVLRYYIDFDVGPTRFDGLLLRDGRLQPPQRLLEVPWPVSEASFDVGDYDGDGFGDIAVVHQPDRGTAAYPQDLTFWLGDGRTTRRGPQRSYAGPVTADYVSADVDGDEDHELVLIDDSASALLSVIDLRDGQVRRPESFGAMRSAATMSPVFGVSDVNGDGRDDIVALAQTGDRRAEITVGVSDGRRLVPRTFATWERRFRTSRFFAYFTFTNRPFT